jgi:protein SCO1/2
MRNYWLISLFLLSCTDPQVSKIPYYNTPDFTPYFLNQAEASEKITHRIKPFTFYKQDSTLFDSKSLQGKVYVANFIFTRCSNICPDMTAQMKRIEKAFRGNKNVALLSFTVTPWYDDVETLHCFAEKNQINSTQWSLLTGPKASIYSLARQSFFAEESIGFNKDTKEFLHTEHVVLVDQQGRIRGIYNGTLPLEADQCIQDIKQLFAKYP